MLIGRATVWLNHPHNPLDDGPGSAYHTETKDFLGGDAKGSGVAFQREGAKVCPDRVQGGAVSLPTWQSNKDNNAVAYINKGKEKGCFSPLAIHP
jgi:hypothetical protein